MTRGPLILTRREVAGLLSLDDCIEAVEAAFCALALGRVPRPGVLGMPVNEGGFHIKAALLDRGRSYFVVKTNGNFPGNRERHGLPTIQGVIVLCDAADGSPLAVMDSIEITTLRTGAATAVAAKYLARPGDTVVAICGCGNQGRVQLRAVSRVRPVSRVYAWDAIAEAAHRFAREMEGELGVPVVPIEELRRATPDTNLWVTCTTSRRAFLGPEQVAPGSFIAAVGADSEDKQELDVDLLAASAIVADILEQCATIGDLHHAIAANRLQREDVRAELGEVVAGTKPGRRSDEETVVFDSTGTAIQDVAAAAVAYERALERSAGIRVDLCC